MASSFEQSTTKTPKKQKIRTVIRNAVEQDWTGANVVPDKGELVYASDVNTLKIGDGTTSYNNLPAISGGGSGGTTDYTDLTNKPQIDGVTLVGNVSTADLGFADVATSGDYNDLSNLPTLGTMAAESANDYTKTSSLSPVAISGSYNDLVNKPSFGTAAYANTTDFATAAQGDLADTAVQPSDLATVATTGNYNDLSNKPSIPAAQVNADWNAASGVAEILNKPSLATVATTGSYNDLSDKPYIPSGVIVDLNYNPVSENAQAGTAVAEAIANKVDSSSLANVAFTGSYNDLSNTPVLGTAAYANTSDFATAAEGDLATTAVQPGDLATVATTGDYSDLLNTPTIPAAQVNADWNAVSGIAQILNKPTLATVATTGDYDDLSNKPTIPTVNNPTITITQGGVTKGSFTLNQATGDTIALDAGSGSQVQSDWDQTDTTAVDYIKNKPTALSDFTNDEGFITYAVTLRDWSVNNS